MLLTQDLILDLQLHRLSIIGDTQIVHLPFAGDEKINEFSCVVLHVERFLRPVNKK